ncbi:uncharacterized protein LOC132866472 [Neoarius graeffei]|uniref:uncharacterized protein LOC132866472 n=1 Tax=Neoarius graeffei TaxID=443677 RepID=UPI00298D2DCF|nr:uncharacterized protein LOC132866472 [Neoarius graeffei]
MWIAPAGKLGFNTLLVLIIDFILATDAKSTKKPTRAPPQVPTTMTSPSSSSHTAVPGTSVIIILSVFAVLLLFAIVLYLFIKWKRNKHDHSSSSNTDHLNNRQLEHTAEDYEEIKDYRFHADQHAVYNNINKATDPSDSPTELEHTAEDFNEIKDTEYHTELCSENTITETPTDPSDPSEPPTDPTQSHEYKEVNFLPHSHCSELESASSSPVQEMND